MKRLYCHGGRYPVKSTADAVFCLIDMIQKRSNDDIKAWVDGTHAYGESKGSNKYGDYYDKLLTRDPIKEFKESYIYEKVCQYFEATRGRVQRSTKVFKTA